MVADIRKQLPAERVDLVLFSDVFYYLYKSEIPQVLFRTCDALADSGFLLFANEWNEGYADLTPPETVLDLLDHDDRYRREYLLKESMNGAGYLTVALYQKKTKVSDP